MAGKRGNGEGTIFKNKEGRWEARITKGYAANGRQLFKYFSAKSREEVAAKLKNYIINKEKEDLEHKPSEQTLANWLDIWYEAYVINKVKTSTRVSNEYIIREHLKPRLGGIKLCRLKGYQAQQMYNELLKNGRVDGKGGLAPKTIRNIHLVLHCALEQAVKEDLILKNPLKSVVLPRGEKKDIEILTVEQQKTLVKECKGSDWGMAIILTLYSGMRLGEVLGLTWDDVDFKNNTLSINKQLGRLKDFDKNAKAKTALCLRNETKTKRSKRMICIASVIMEELKNYQKKQALKIKLWGSNYNNLNMVFCRGDGNYVDPSTFRDFYLKKLDDAGIGHKTFHALRHTFATRALESNAHIKTVSELLGHASVQITLDTYSHVSQDLQKETMEKIAGNFF